MKNKIAVGLIGLVWLIGLVSSAFADERSSGHRSSFSIVEGGVVTGPLLLPDGTAAAPAASFASQTTMGLYKAAANQLGISNVGAGSGIVIGGGSPNGLYVYNGVLGLTDTYLVREAANTLALRNGVSAQQMNIYDSYTDAGNYRRIGIYSAAGTQYIQTQSAGGTASGYLVLGSQNNLYFQAGVGGTPTTYAQLSPTAFGPAANDALDLAAAATQFKSLLLSRSIQGSKSKTLTDASATGFVQIALPQTLGLNFTSGTILWQVHCDNGSTTVYADRAGQTVFTCNNISGTEACVFDATAQQVTQAATYSLAAPAWTATGGTDTATLNVNADCAGVVGPTNMYIHYRLDILDPQTVTPQ